MNCWHCKTELVWNGDYSIDDTDDDYQMVSHLTCPNKTCQCLTQVFVPKLLEKETLKERQVLLEVIKGKLK